MIVDAHQHLWYDIQDGDRIRRYFPQRQGWDVCMNWAYGGMPPYTLDPAALYPRQLGRMSDYEGTYTISSMDYHGVDASYIFPVDYDLNFGQSSDITVDEKLQHLYELSQKYPGRILHFAQIDPRRTDAYELLKRAITEYKVNAYKIIPGCGYYPWDPILFPLYDLCLDYGIPLATCVEGSHRGYRFSRHSHPVHVGDMMAEFRDLKVIMLHAGYPFLHWFDECLAAARHVNCYIEPDSFLMGTSLRGRRGGRYMGPNMFEGEDQLITMFAKAKSWIGCHKVMFGTDSAQGPAFNGPDAVNHYGWKSIVDWFRALPEKGAKRGYQFEPSEIDLMLGDNAARVIGLTKDPQWEIPHKFGWKYRYPSPNRRPA